MNMFEIINKSQSKIKLTKEDIFWMVKQFTDGDLPDYQMSTWLGTVFLNQLSEEETAWLTQALCDSGEKLSWDQSSWIVDKHSTGGVGDKTSLIIGPLVASMGYQIPMMAGRGLGHTGGTIDKLESFGFQTSLDAKTFKKNVQAHNLCIIGQSKDFCPADKKLYALRDATHTVANIPLICSSIMSKKIAEGLKGLVLDVKFGSGAFMKNLSDAKSLAQKLVSIGEKSHITTYGVLTSMNQPLGRYIGNKLEILECIEILKNPEEGFKKYPDNVILSVLLSALMIFSKNTKDNLSQIFDQVFTELMSGKAYHKFLEVVKAQSGDLSQLEIKAKKFTLNADQSGFMNYTDVKALGFSAVALGAGRFKKEDDIDFNVGFYCYKKSGDKVQKNEPIFDIYFNHETKLNECLDQLKKSYTIQLTPPSTTQLINEIISFKDGKFNSVNIKTKYFEV